MRKRAAVVGVVVGMVLGAVARGEEAPPPRVFQTDGRVLLEARERFRGKDPGVARQVKTLIKDAEKAMGEGPWSVAYKKKPLPGIDVHEYVSLAPYHWPDPSKPDGLPYVRKDGVRNPEVNEYDAPVLDAFTSRVYTLGAAAYVTGEKKYAERAAQVIRVFLLDEATAMRPNLEHGQMIRGVNLGRNAGMIETRRLLCVADAIGLIADSGAWTAEDQAKAEGWFRAFVTWMQESEMGKKEGEATNNHGTWYDVQVVTHRLFLGDVEEAKRVVEKAKSRRIGKQIEPDGSMPKELVRTKSLSYSSFNLLAMATLADLGKRVGVDLWHHRTEDGRSMRGAIDYLLPYALGEKKWEHPQIAKYNPAPLAIVLRRAGEEFGEARYLEAGKKLEVKDGELDEPLPGTQF